MSDDAEPELGHRVQVVSAVKRYGLTTALGGVDFEVAPGEFLVLLGPSGSGKSTLIRSLAGIERLDSGEVRLSGQLVSAGKANVPPERRDLAMVFQDYALWPHLTAGGNVGYALRRRRLDTATAGERVTAALRRVGLADHALRYPHELSGGEQQRVALARALVARPRLLLFDEPLSNLDADLRERLRVEIGTLTRESGSTAIYITHDQSEAFALADKVGVLDRGTIVQFGRPEEIYRRPATPFVARFTGVAGELTGRVAHVHSGLAAVQVEGSVIDARTIGTMRSGESARVLVRPAAARLSGRPPAPKRWARTPFTAPSSTSRIADAVTTTSLPLGRMSSRQSTHHGPIDAATPWRSPSMPTTYWHTPASPRRALRRTMAGVEVGRAAAELINRWRSETSTSATPPTAVAWTPTDAAHLLHVRRRRSFRIIDVTPAGAHLLILLGRSDSCAPPECRREVGLRAQRFYELTDPLGCRAGQNFTVCVYRVGIGIVRFRAVRSRCAHGMRCRLDRTAFGLRVLPASQAAAAASHNAANTQEPRMSDGQCTPRYSRVAATATA